MPGPVEALRPHWLALVLIYWILMETRRVGLLTAWLVGLLLDTLHGVLLGQHALALVLIGFVTQYFSLRVRVFPIGQQIATVFMLVAFYEFMLFWVDGVTGAPSAGWVRWLPVLTSAAMWPLVVYVLGLLRRPAPAGDTV